MRVLDRLLGETGGAAAVEFAIVAPLLLFGLIAMIDTGVMATTRMEMDRNVRAGAQAAMSLNKRSHGDRDHCSSLRR
jgi:Flp pilus assembly protein TadG